MKTRGKVGAIGKKSPTVMYNPRGERCAEDAMTRNPQTNTVKLSIQDYLVLIGIIIPVVATIVFTSLNKQRELGVKIETVIVQQEVIDDRVARVERTLDTLLLHDAGLER